MSIIKFNGTEEEINDFTTRGYNGINAICKCNAMQTNGIIIYIHNS